MRLVQSDVIGQAIHINSLSTYIGSNFTALDLYQNGLYECSCSTQVMYETGTLNQYLDGFCEQLAAREKCSEYWKQDYTADGLAINCEGSCIYAFDAKTYVFFVFLLLIFLCVCIKCYCPICCCCMKFSRAKTPPRLRGDDPAYKSGNPIP